MISVIVPIHNVESYLPQCLESLNAQTFSDVEFVLVDDGSTDKSGEIADSYSGCRFRVFHTTNCGLSAARNYGLEKARGEWLMFVDGDDYVAPEFCEKPIKAALSSGADLLIFRAFSVRNGKVKKLNWGGVTPPTGIISVEDAMKYGECTAWNKLYRRELFEGIEYPEGMAHEDLAVTHKVILKAKRIVMLPDFLYYYVHRSGSISNTNNAKSKKDGLVLAEQRAEELREIGYNDSVLWTRAIAFLATAYPTDDPVFHQAEEVVNAIPGIPRNLPWKHKAALAVWKLNPELFHILCRILGQKDNSV